MRGIWRGALLPGVPDSWSHGEPNVPVIAPRCGSGLGGGLRLRPAAAPAGAASRRGEASVSDICGCSGRELDALKRRCAAGDCERTCALTGVQRDACADIALGASR